MLLAKIVYITSLQLINKLFIKEYFILHFNLEEMIDVKIHKFQKILIEKISKIVNLTSKYVASVRKG